MKFRDAIARHAYPVMAGLSTISLLLIALSLVPISRWAGTQNECVQRTYRTAGTNNAGIPTKVWSCNGGGY